MMSRISSLWLVAGEEGLIESTGLFESRLLSFKAELRQGSADYTLTTLHFGTVHLATRLLVFILIPPDLSIRECLPSQCTRTAQLSIAFFAMPAPVHYGVVLYPGFQLLDVAGPLDILNLLSQNHELKLSILSSTLEPVTTLQPGAKTTFAQSIVPTHTFSDAPADIEVLLVPGGLGARDEANIQPAIDYVRTAYPKLQYLITVCTGSALVAKAGILDGIRATSNKAAFEWVGCLCQSYACLS